jgi:hypothetical protein
MECLQRRTGSYGKVRSCSQIMLDGTLCPNKANESCYKHDDSNPWICNDCAADPTDSDESTITKRPDPKLVCGCNLGNNCSFDPTIMDITISSETHNI